MKSTFLSWSSGKDSALALYELRRNKINISGLLTVIDAQSQTVAMHKIPKELVVQQAASLKLPIHFVEMQWPCSNECYQKTMHDSFKQLSHRGVDSIAYADLFLEDIKAFRESLHDHTNIEPSFPLFGKPTKEMARYFVHKGFKATLICVNTEQMDSDYLGKAFDLWPQLEIDPCGENGEFHTFCWDGPIFETPIAFKTKKTSYQGHFAFLDLEP